MKIQENKIQEHTGTSFSIVKVDDISILKFSDECKINNTEDYATIVLGDCTNCEKIKLVHNISSNLPKLMLTNQIRPAIDRLSDKSLLINFNELNERELMTTSHPFSDGLIFVFNIIPMYMMGKKIIESWIYFIVIDIYSGIFFYITEAYFFSFLFFCYIAFATYGYIAWKKEIT